jgi:hypothetical protein
VRGALSFVWRDELAVRVLAIAACIVFILGAKLWLIAAYGSNVPFWDQWDEGSSLYLPYLAGKLSIADIFSAHNEHRIALMRLAHLAQFMLDPRWQPVLETVINAAVHAVAIGIVVALLARALDRADALLVALFAALAFAVPFGWGNTLVGFQLQYYLLVLLAPVALAILAPSAAFTPRWWIGTTLGVVTYFIVASGALTLGAAAALVLIQLVFGMRRGRNEWLGLLVHAVLFAAMLWDIPRIPGHAALAPKSLTGVYESFVVAASWPVAKPNWTTLQRTGAVLVIYLPVLVLALRLLRARAPIEDRRWLVIALAGWAMLQLLTLALARGVAILETRYFDFFLMGPLAALAALLINRADANGMWRTVTTVFAGAWLCTLFIGGGHKALSTLPDELSAWRQQSDARRMNFSRFLTTGDFAALTNKPPLHIPYPSAERLREIVADSSLRAILPPELMNRPEQTNRLRTFSLRQGPLLLPIGIALFMAAGLLAGSSVQRR